MYFSHALGGRTVWASKQLPARANAVVCLPRTDAFQVFHEGHHRDAQRKTEGRNVGTDSISPIQLDTLCLRTRVAKEKIMKARVGMVDRCGALASSAPLVRSRFAGPQVAVVGARRRSAFSSQTEFLKGRYTHTGSFFFLMFESNIAAFGSPRPSCSPRALKTSPSMRRCLFLTKQSPVVYKQQR